MNGFAAASITKANPGNFAPSDFVPQQQGMNKGTKNTSYDYLFAETSTIIKLEDLAKLVSHVQSSFKDLDSPEEDHVIVVDDSDEDEDDEVHATENHKLELEKNKAETEAALLKAQLSFSNVEQLKELLVKSLKTKFSNILSAHDFSSSLPTELKDLPSKLNELTGEVKGLKKQVHELEIELPGDLKEIPTKLDDFTKNVTSLTSQVVELKTLHLLLNFTQALNKFAQVLDSASSKARDQSSSQPEGEHIKKDKGKKAMSLKDAEEVSTKSESDDETTHVPGSMCTKEIEEEAKAEAARREGEIRKEELIDLLGPEVVNKPLSKHDPLDILNDLANKKRKHADDSHDFFRANKRLKQDFVTIEDFRDFSNTMLYTVQEIFFRLHQGPGLDDHARTFSSLLLAKLIENLTHSRDGGVIEQTKANRMQSFVNNFSFEFCICNESLNEVLRRLGSIFTSVYAAVQKLKKDSWKELQFSLVDNSKLNVVYLLNRS
ncbi:hypothetical protein Tco_0032752 [Tanacetum coccineum]